MNGQKKSSKMMGPYEKKDIPNIQIDYGGLVAYARSKNVSVANLSDEEKNRYIKNATIDDVKKIMIS